MWILLRCHAGTLMPADAAPTVVDDDAAAESAADIIGDGQHLVEEIRKVMAYMAEKGHQDTPEFREIVAAYKEVSGGVGELQRDVEAQAEAELQAAIGGKFAGELLQEREAAAQQDDLPAAVREKIAARPLSAGANLAGVELLTELLGPAGRPGFTCMGPQVTSLQKILAAAGFPAPVNGRFDRPTGEAVRQFQQTYGLEPDGLVTAATRQALNALLVPA